MLDLYIIRDAPKTSSHAEARQPQRVPLLPEAGSGSVFEGLMAYWIHQDDMLWERANTLIAVQGGLFAGAYALRSQPRAVALMLMSGAVLCLLLYLIMLRHIAHRDANEIVMSRIFAALVRDGGMSEEALRMVVPTTLKAPVKASYILRGIVVFFIAFDLYIAGVLLGYWEVPRVFGLPSGWPATLPTRG